MRTLILLIAWITPAFIAGALGWKGIWGGSSAFFDYLIPVPVAGGVFHVPSFIVASILIISLKKYPDSVAKGIPLFAIGVFLAAQTLLLDFDRLNAWLFTDYAPARSPFRFDKNPLLLFVATDALWVATYALAIGFVPRLRTAILLLFIPVTLIGFKAGMYQFGGPKFDYGFSTSTKEYGNDIAMIYTPNTYNEKQFREWWETDTIVTRPWETQNAESLAVLFSNSMQDIKWHKRDNVDNIVATFCVYEQDKSLTTHAGYHDCFAGRVTFRQKLGDSYKSTNTGLGKEVDSWFARVALCEGVKIPDAWGSDIELINLCIGMYRHYREELQRISEQYGEHSEQVAFLRKYAHFIGIDDSR